MSYSKDSMNGFYSKRYYSDACEEPSINSTPMSRRFSNVFPSQMTDSRLSKRLCTAPNALTSNSPLNRTNSLHLQSNPSNNSPHRRRDSSLLTFTASPVDRSTDLAYSSNRPNYRHPITPTMALRRSSSVHTSFPFCVPSNGTSSIRSNLAGSASLLQSLHTSHNVMRDRDEKDSVIRALKILESKKRRFDECVASDRDDGTESISRDEIRSELNVDNNSKRQRLLSHSSLLDDRSSVSSLTGSSSRDMLTKLRDDETFQLTSIGDIVSPNARSSVRKSFSGLGGRKQSLRRTLLDPEGNTLSFSAMKGPGTISDQASTASSQEFSPKTLKGDAPSATSSVVSGAVSDRSRASGQSNLSMRRKLSYMTPAQIEAHATKRSAAAQLMRRDSIDNASQRNATQPHSRVLSPSKRNNITQTDSNVQQSSDTDISKPSLLRNKTISVSEFIANLDKNRRQVNHSDDFGNSVEFLSRDSKKHSNTVLENRLSRIRRLLVNFTDEAKQPSNSCAEITGPSATTTVSTSIASTSLSFGSVLSANPNRRTPEVSQSTSLAPLTSSLSFPKTSSTSLSLTNVSTSEPSFPNMSVTTSGLSSVTPVTVIASTYSVMSPAGISFGETNLKSNIAAVSVDTSNIIPNIPPLQTSLANTNLKIFSGQSKPVSSVGSFNSTFATTTAESTQPRSSFSFGSSNVSQKSSIPSSTTGALIFSKPASSIATTTATLLASTVTDTPASGGFSFRKSTPVETQSSTSFSFGKGSAPSISAPTTEHSFNKPAELNTGLNFGQPQDLTGTSKVVSTTFSFGKQADTSSSATIKLGNTTIAPQNAFSSGTTLSQMGKPVSHQKESFHLGFNHTTVGKPTEKSKAASIFSFGKTMDDSAKLSTSNFTFNKTNEKPETSVFGNTQENPLNTSAFNFIKSSQHQEKPLISDSQKTSTYPFGFGKAQENKQASFTFGKSQDASNSSLKTLAPTFNTNGSTSAFSFGQTKVAPDTSKTSLFGSGPATTTASSFGSFGGGINTSNQSPFGQVATGLPKTFPTSQMPSGLSNSSSVSATSQNLQFNMTPTVPSSTTAPSYFGGNTITQFGLSNSSSSLPSSGSIFGQQSTKSFVFNTATTNSKVSAQPSLLFSNSAPSASPLSEQSTSVIKPFGESNPQTLFPSVATNPGQNTQFSIKTPAETTFTFGGGTANSTATASTGFTKSGGFNFGSQCLQPNTAFPVNANVFNQTSSTSLSGRKKNPRKK